MKLHQIIILILIFSFTFPLTANAMQQSMRKIVWGGSAHTYINSNAVDYLPSGMSFFIPMRDFLGSHASDADFDGTPRFWHWIDIDFYPEFETGTLTHNLDTLLASYGASTVATNGIIPWMIEAKTDTLSMYMAAGDWDNVWQEAANLGHFIGDSHEPLHLTLNFNGGVTGNFGIHSRYESSLINQHLSELPLPDTSGIFWENVIDSVFQYIDDLYPSVALIIDADNSAVAVDPGYGSAYYDLMWAELDSISLVAVNTAIIDLASVWQTAWINAGRPDPTVTNVNHNSILPLGYSISKNYPNPFNPSTTINFQLPENSYVKIAVFNLRGEKITTLIDRNINGGSHNVIWNGRSANGSPLPSGIYFYKITVGDFSQTRKMILLK